MNSKIFEELKQLSASYAELQKEAKAFQDTAASPESDNQMKYMEDTMYKMISNVHDRIDYLSNAISEWVQQHQNGHIPAAKSASQMKNAIKNLGWSEDYEVMTPKVSVATAGNTVTAEITYNKS